jgi:hypothetical protein
MGLRARRVSRKLAENNLRCASSDSPCLKSSSMDSLDVHNTGGDKVVVVEDILRRTRSDFSYVEAAVSTLTPLEI